MKSAAALLAEARTRITEIGPVDVQRELTGADPPLVIDVRERDEWLVSRLPGAIHMPRGTLEWMVEPAVPRSRRIIVYCAVGGRSALAADTLRTMGYQSVASLAGGIAAWIAAGAPLASEAAETVATRPGGPPGGP